MTQAPEAPTGATLDAEASDAELISRVRGGDVDAYGGLFERHRDAANRLARQLVPGPDADDLVAEAFAKVLNVLLAGGGPDVALRPYLLTAVRRLHVDKIRSTKRAMPTDDLTPYDPGVQFNDTVISGFEGGAAAQAFASLPERWQLVLWHLEVEGQKPADIAPMLGMTPNSVSALAYRAREGLRQAFLQMHTADLVEADCKWTHDKLGAYVREGLSRRDNVKVEAHLDGCRKCTAIFLELREVNSELAALLGPIVLGSATAAYLAAGTAAAGAVKGGILIGFATKAREGAKNPAVAAATVIAVAAAAAGGFALTNGDDTPPSAGPKKPAASAPPADTPPASEPPATTPPPASEPPATTPPPTTAPTTSPTTTPTETVDSVAPTAPGNLRVLTTTARSGGLRTMAATATGFRAVWDRSTDNEGVDAYDVYVNGRRADSVGGTGYTFSGLEKGKRYAVYVVARDEAGNKSAKSNTVRFETEPGTTPPPPIDNEAPVVLEVKGTVAGTTATFTWRGRDNSGSVDRYEISLDGGTATTTSNTRATFPDLPPGRHTLTVTAIDAAGNRSAAVPGSVTVPDPNPVNHAPTAPTNLASTNVESDSFDLSWSASTDPDGDTVTYLVQGLPSSASVQRTGATSARITGLQPDTGYDVSVQASDGQLTATSDPHHVQTDPAATSLTVTAIVDRNGNSLNGNVVVSATNLPVGGVQVTLTLSLTATWSPGTGCTGQTCTITLLPGPDGSATEQLSIDISGATPLVNVLF